MNSKDFDWNKNIKECLEKTFYCCLGTFGDEGVWTNPVYFAYDNDLNFYFISNPRSRHMQNIIENETLSISIYDTKHSPSEPHKGIQLKGDCYMVDEEDIAKVFNIYFSRAEKGNAKAEDYLNDSEWRFCKVEPTEIWYFDTEFFGEERKQVPDKFNLN